ncbi:MAG: phosphatase PAP2 family protein [Bacillota bacterium]|nr:phosphatase PAP2 family protein [Bacillota bacterium]
MTVLNQMLNSVGGDYIALIFLCITRLVSPVTISIAAVIVYWCLDKKKGIAIASAVTISVSLNAFLKKAFAIDRPYVKDTAIKQLDLEASGYSFPSGHAQQISTIMSGMYFNYRNLWMLIAGITLIVSVDISRIYLGVHSVSDVIVGTVIGIILAWVINALVIKILKSDHPKYLYFLCIFQAILFYVYRNSDIIKMTGASFGAVTGYIIEEKLVGYRPPHEYRDKIRALIVGLVTTGCLKFLTAEFLGTSRWYYVFLDYCIFGFAVTALVPATIKALGISNKHKGRKHA